MNKRTSATLALATLLLLGSSVHAQAPAPTQRPIRLGFGGGFSVPIDDVEASFDNGINGEAFLLINLGGFPLRLNLGYQKMNLKDLVPQQDAGSAQILSGVGGLQLNLLNGPFRPYLHAGVGAFSMSTETGGAASESEIKFGIDAGAGLAISLGPFDAFIEGRIQNIYTDQGVIDFKTVRLIPVTFGILF
jgi:hypothetical protein